MRTKLEDVVATLVPGGAEPPSNSVLAAHEGFEIEVFAIDPSKPQGTLRLAKDGEVREYPLRNGLAENVDSSMLGGEWTYVPHPVWG